MPRYSKKTYRRQMWMSMAIYCALIVFEWPQARHATGLPWKVVLAILPTVPVIAVFCLKARLVIHSDELEQRVELMALSVATGVVAVVSMIGGFLCSADVFRLDGDILIWMFPVLGFTYGAARWLFGQRYGGMGCG